MLKKYLHPTCGVRLMILIFVDGAGNPRHFSFLRNLFRTMYGNIGALARIKYPALIGFALHWNNAAAKYPNRFEPRKATISKGMSVGLSLTMNEPGPPSGRRTRMSRTQRGRGRKLANSHSKLSILSPSGVYCAVAQLLIWNRSSIGRKSWYQTPLKASISTGVVGIFSQNPLVMLNCRWHLPKASVIAKRTKMMNVRNMAVYYECR